MSVSLKQRVGALLIDAPRYVYFFLRKTAHGGPAWMLIKNRRETLELSTNKFGIKCNWPWTSNLYLPKVFPIFGKVLFAKALNSFSFQFTQQKEPCNSVTVSFIIGHRGLSRSALLLKTIDSIAAQKNCNVECIVVEQDSKPMVRDLLPKWVEYIFTQTENIAYSRAQAFNVGAQHASSDCLIFHDNDLLVSSNYASETLTLINQGFDFVNLKRFIYYLSESATKRALSQRSLEKDLAIENIMQNAQGGGSIGASRKSYFKIGGFDERFIGWGGEDNEFWERAQTTKVWQFGFLPLIHLWHSPQVDKLDTEDSEPNILYKKLSQQSATDRIKWLTRNQTNVMREADERA